MSGRENLFFGNYQIIEGQIYAVFYDIFSGENRLMTRDDCATRLAKLKKNKIPFNETQKAIDGWPRY